MKTLLVIIGTILGLSAYAIDNGSGEAPPLPAPSLSGRYILVERECVNGQLPRDQFDLRRDSLEVMFDDGKYFSQSRIAGCRAISYGDVELKEEFMVLYDNYAADCTHPIMPIGKYTYLFSSHNDEITLKIFTGVGGSCNNDYLKTTFKRTH